MSTDLAIRGETLPALPAELTIEELVAQSKKIHAAMEAVMTEGVHYGKVPGVDKPFLFQAGAEKLMLLFRFDAQFASAETWDGPHLTVKTACTLYHMPTGNRLGMGEGSCSTKESRYAYRQAKRSCPKCGAETINKSKFPPKGAMRGTEPGWYCYAKVGGCGQEFGADDPAIVDQKTGRVANENLPDTYNTVLKMAAKRAKVAAVINATGCSDIVTQDEDFFELGEPAAGSVTPKASAEQSAQGARGSGDSGSSATEPSQGRISQAEVTMFWTLANRNKWSKAQVGALLAELAVPAADQIPMATWPTVEAILSKAPTVPA